MPQSSSASAITERTLTQADFDAFAKLSGDDNPIHVDPVFSARTRFGGTVSHGMLLYTILRGLADKLAPGGRQISQDLMFPAPAFAGDCLRFEALLVAASDGACRIAMSATRLSDSVVVCEGASVLSNEGNDLA